MAGDNQKQHRSDEWLLTPQETIRLIAAEAAKAAAESAAVTALASRDGIVEHIVAELKGLRLDLKPVIEANIRHATILEDHKRQLGALWEKDETNLDKAKEHAASVAKSVIRDEMVSALKETKTFWRGVMPSIVGSVATAVIVVFILYALGFQKKEKDDPKQPQPVSHPVPGAP